MKAHGALLVSYNQQKRLTEGREMKKTPLEVLDNRQIALPAKGAGVCARFLLGLMTLGSNVKYSYAFDKEEMRGKQVILLADHATKDAYKYVLSGYPFVMPNVVIGYQNIFVKGLFSLLLKGGIIPKKLYQADAKAAMDMFKVLKMGGSLCIFPEGIQSTVGSTHPIFTGTAKLLKKAGVPVVLCKSYGAYLVKPRYKKRENKGRQEYRYEILFTEEELKRLSIEEIDERLLKRFSYNDFEWNKTAREKYVGKEPLAKGIESILYRCPKCGGEFTVKTVGEEIVCGACGNTVVLNEYYDLAPKTAADYLPYASIDEWFLHQRKLVGEEVKEKFCYEYECEAYDVHTDKLSTSPYYVCGEGVITLTNEGVRYKGTRHGENVDLFFDMKGIPSFVFTPNQDNDLYYENIYYSFRPKTDRAKVVKYMLLTEEAHRLVSEAWDKISRDAYEKNT